jgi:DNA-binding response OmpR family regulator
MKAKILVADDDLLYRTLFSTSLDEFGFEVRCVNNGAEALEALTKEPFDLLLLDLIMPVLDGFGTLSQLQTKKLMKRPPVIIISATDESDALTRCFAAGAIDMLPKPFEPAMLQVRVHAALVHAKNEQLSQRVAASARVLSSLSLSGSLSQPDRDKLNVALELLSM